MSIRIHDKDPKIYIVLGCPYSATSFITKAIQDQGVEMNANWKYVYEDPNFVWLNELILSQAGGTWTEPPPEKDILDIDIHRQIKRLLKHRSKGDFWGFKDPRTSLTIQKYLPYLQGDPYLICCFRRPHKVVDSSTNKFRLGREAVDRYNKAIINGIKRFCGL